MPKRKAPNIRIGAPDDQRDDFPFSIELWNPGKDKIDRVLALAATLSLARAMFKAARNEYPDRYITLRNGEKVITSGQDA